MTPTLLGILAPSGSTGDNTHDPVGAGTGPSRVCCQFVVEDAGGTPTVDWKLQGSVDGANWYDVEYVTDASDSAAADAITVTDPGAQVIFLDVAGGSRFYLAYRLVTSSNTNITYRGELYAA